MNTVNESRFISDVLNNESYSGYTWVGYNWEKTDVSGELNAWWYVCEEEAVDEADEETDSFYNDVQADYKTAVSNESEPFVLLAYAGNGSLAQNDYLQTLAFVCEFESVCFRHANFCVHGSCALYGVNENCDCTGTGYTGKRCETEIDECEGRPCENEGICIDNVGSFECNCSGTGYNGTICDINIDDCETSECVHGFCVDGINNYTCDCNDTGHTGGKCDTDIDECTSNPCANGVCDDRINGYICDCTNTIYIGTNCSMLSCDSNPCINGVCVSQINQYSCLCNGTAFTGALCEIAVDNCEGDSFFNGTSCLPRAAESSTLDLAITLYAVIPAVIMVIVIPTVLIYCTRVCSCRRSEQDARSQLNASTSTTEIDRRTGITSTISDDESGSDIKIYKDGDDDHYSKNDDDDDDDATYYEADGDNKGDNDENSHKDYLSVSYRLDSSASDSDATSVTSRDMDSKTESEYSK